LITNNNNNDITKVINIDKDINELLQKYNEKCLSEEYNLPFLLGFLLLGKQGQDYLLKILELNYKSNNIIIHQEEVLNNNKELSNEINDELTNKVNKEPLKELNESKILGRKLKC